jgi:hypothetical protein
MAMLFLHSSLVIALCSIRAHGEGFGEIEETGKDREEWFRRFLELPYGIPDEDTFRRIFERLNPGELMKYPQNWLRKMGEAGGRQVSIDVSGDTITIDTAD